ncbi:hypothetical protein C4569_00260 [Candidatus Parcubacteria bacterium]|nr:MAG: hypothetical protein C4569_00260 [Candidatus Parcubacteria bacterium]
MYEKINQPIEVLVFFKGTKIQPLYFKHRNKKYKIEKLNLIHYQKNGQGKIYYFNVTDKTTYFKLSFNTNNLQWRLEEMYCEG